MRPTSYLAPAGRVERARGRVEAFERGLLAQGSARAPGSTCGSARSGMRIAFVEQTALRVSASWSGNGMKCSRALSHRLPIAGCLCFVKLLCQYGMSCRPFERRFLGHLSVGLSCLVVCLFVIA